MTWGRENEQLVDLRIATWNLDRPKPRSARARELAAQIVRIDADVWVLTESHVAFSPGREYNLVAHSSRLNSPDPAECWVAIWTRIGGQLVETTDTDRTAAVRLNGRRATKITVYGTVLPWLGSYWRDKPPTDGIAFGASLRAQADEWCAFSAEGELCVAGDLNQDLLTRGHYYGSKKNRSALLSALAEARLECANIVGGDAVSRHTRGGAAGIDHICVTPGLSIEESSCLVWPDVAEFDSKLSDHFGLSVRVSAG